jgi:hypothetical protein
MKVTAFRGAAGYLLALIIVLATWAVGMPRFGSPDEPAHVYKAYGTAHGELLGAPAPGFPDNLREFDGTRFPRAAEPQLLRPTSGRPRSRARPTSCRG